MKAIAHGLNQARVPFPAKDTKRGPARLGWTVSTVYTIVRNEKYAGHLDLEPYPVPPGPGHGPPAPGAAAAR